MSAPNCDVNLVSTVYGDDLSDKSYREAQGLMATYPDLKANENMMQLTEEITTTENKVAFARQAYNDAVMSYNILRESVPNNFIAGPFGFGPAEMLEIEDPVKREAVKVDFG